MMFMNVFIFILSVFEAASTACLVDFICNL